MQSFIETVVKALVRFPDQATVTPVERHGATLYELRLEPSDVGRVVGKSGKTINALRSVLLTGSAKKGVRCSLEIIEDKP
ncbi:MAG: KH domain-containing protein, partial [Verrucomicrobia bacterium]|nr:KH domain-containing protein [Verrucomicrobiota bacterium]